MSFFYSEHIPIRQSIFTSSVKSVVVIKSCISSSELIRKSGGLRQVRSSRHQAAAQLSPVSSFMSFISASFSESAAVLCCPCEPNFLNISTVYSYTHIVSVRPYSSISARESAAKFFSSFSLK